MQALRLQAFIASNPHLVSSCQVFAPALCPKSLKTLVLLDDQAAGLCQKPCLDAPFAINQHQQNTWVTG